MKKCFTKILIQTKIPSSSPSEKIVFHILKPHYARGQIDSSYDPFVLTVNSIPNETTNDKGSGQSATGKL